MNGTALWSQDTCVGAIDRAEQQLSIALDFGDVSAVGWLTLTAAQLANWARFSTEMGNYYTLVLPWVEGEGN